MTHRVDDSPPTAPSQTLPHLFWQVIHREFYGVTSAERLTLLDAATGFAALAGGVATSWRRTGTETMTVRHSVHVITFALAVVLGVASAAGWAAALTSATTSRAAETVVPPHHSLAHMWWLPAVSAIAPGLCAYCYWTLETTVAEARTLRELKYEHKRA